MVILYAVYDVYHRARPLVTDWAAACVVVALDILGCMEWGRASLGDALGKKNTWRSIVFKTFTTPVKVRFGKVLERSLELLVDPQISTRKAL